MPKQFWTEYSQSAGVYTVGEVFNGDYSYVAGYQGPMDGLLNYPLYYKLLTAYQKQQSMRAIHDAVTTEVFLLVCTVLPQPVALSCVYCCLPYIDNGMLSQQFIGRQQN